MPIRLDLVEVGMRVAYEDRANPRREGRVVEIVKLGGETPGGLPLPSGVEYRIRWDDIPDQFDDSIVERASALIRSGTPQGKAWRQAIAEARETTSDLRQHGWTMLADLPGNPFDGADVVSVYTRGDAIRDGVLVPTLDLVPDEPDFAREAGWAVPVALTAAVANIVIPTEREARDYHQDVKGRLWDLLHMAAMYGARRDASEVVFPCIFWLAGPDRVAAGLVERAQQKRLRFKTTIGPGDEGDPVATIMLPEED